MKALTKYALMVAVLLAFAVPSFAGKKATVKIINQSKWEIHHIFLSGTEDESWGEDQLEDDVLAKGQAITITGIPCAKYDVKVVDEDGDECIIEEVELCGDNSYWKITDKALLACEGYN